ncbi:sulfurtransferase [Paenibacillus hemerocallicola]|uniref:Sulfurtransferase n=1 Tax=Paenibacillus hemerocallicola TaxID=1172614 RepID=A0A5C4TDP0_9BACL|nr:rhodanese-like domain-containing protein [Paenibacillus hemerocallicola]TNJ66962.1 sulfurtransferase [Paenibacillus hemerocallicola]
MVESQNAYPNYELLADIEWLEERLQQPDLLLLDVRNEGYEQEHIPGARHLQSDLLKHPGAIEIVPLETARVALERVGLRGDSTVVLYDDGKSALAARVFYDLEYYGLRDRVKLLDGGFTAWKAAGKQVTEEVPPAKRGDWSEAVAHPARITTKQNIQEGLTNSLLLDVRSAEEYSGANKWNNRKGGHIPGAAWLEWKSALALNEPDGVPRFKPAAVLEKQLAQVGVRRELTIVPYCQLNSRGAHTYFVLRLLDFPDVRPYEGAWEEWGNDEDTEVSV